jgi:hypothetical protein
MPETFNSRTLAQLLDELGDVAVELKTMAFTVDVVNEKTPGTINISPEGIIPKMNRILEIKNQLYGLLEEQEISLVSMSKAEHLRQRNLEEESD